ncbi:MAG: hypothetical protein M3042_01390 [Actinomycetota bacterium]|nr:hypothetical protein [Actinomycetota bacterium]
MELLAAWTNLVHRLGGHPDPAAGRRLLARYAEPHRHYHTVTHLVAVLSTVDTLAPEAAEPDIARLAGWYHDAVYNPSRSDNEECSALLAEDELAQMVLPHRYVERVAALVRITAAHHPPAGDAEAAVLCDADLAVLAAPAPEYDAYVAAVRREYAHVGDAGWRVGRGDVLGRLVALPQLFWTRPARAWEPGARANLSRELAGLAGPSAGADRPR